MLTVNLHDATTAPELLATGHPHIGRVEKGKWLATLFGILTATNRKLYSIDTMKDGKSHSVALSIDVSRFMLTIGRSFILLTMQEGNKRHPIIQKTWRRVERSIGRGFTAQFGSEDTYIDVDNLKWQHRYRRPGEPDEISAYDSDEKEVLLLTFETFE